MTLLLVQVLNGLQLGVLLFLIAAGLTVVFGVMDLINLAHGVQYMLGAYLAVLGYGWTGSFALSLLLAIGASFAAGFLVDALVFRHLLGRDHLDQVLATYGLILLFEEGVRTLFGPAPLSLPMPDALSGTVALPGGLNYPVYRLVLLACGLGVAALLWAVIERTRAGMLVRAGASNAPILEAMGVDVRRLFTLVVATGAMLAGFAGALAAPLIAVEPGMGGGVLILAFVVIVVGGVGSIRGAFVAALLVGLTDALGRSYIGDLLRLVLSPSAARTAGPALASMAIYRLMALVLGFRPRGLLPARGQA
jgi:branched-chain amino acid transport system permease protein